MAGGYMGKLLFVDLSQGTLKNEPLTEQMCRDFIGCQGVGARVLYERMKPGVDPLGPDNMLGLVSGPLTGTPAIAGARYAAVAKSPLTGAWGEANSGGDFGPYMKFAGFDGVFFSGISLLKTVRLRSETRPTCGARTLRTPKTSSGPNMEKTLGSPASDRPGRRSP